MKSSIFLPKTINVGYQNRNDTYTKKLAYVIYYDEKGVLRKEKSWNSWRDENIPNTEYDNVPTEGFVLNKKVGGYDTGWNHRQTYTRVYDPRGFEFEITIENLLYILENTSSIKGKGLEGEFVYGWDGKDLVLIPTSSPDYKQIEDFNSIIHNKETIKAKDLIVGATYLDKDNVEYVYMGKFDYYGYTYGYKGKAYKTWRALKEAHPNFRYSDYECVNCNLGKRFFFCVKSTWEKSGYKFVDMTSISKKFIKCQDINCHQDYAEMFDLLERNTSYSPLDKSKYEYIDLPYEEFEKYILSMPLSKCNYKYIMSHEKMRLEIKYSYDDTKRECIKDLFTCHTQNGNIPLGFKTKTVDVKPSYSRFTEKKEFEIPVTLKEIYDIIKPIYKNRYLANGKFYNKDVAWNE